MMTRKDYVAIAAALREVRPTQRDREQWARDCAAVSRVFEEDNPRFISSRFFKACGISPDA